jgi:hypothetical protein
VLNYCTVSTSKQIILSSFFFLFFYFDFAPAPSYSEYVNATHTATRDKTDCEKGYATMAASATDARAPTSIPAAKPPTPTLGQTNVAGVPVSAQTPAPIPANGTEKRKPGRPTGQKNADGTSKGSTMDPRLSMVSAPKFSCTVVDAIATKIDCSNRYVWAMAVEAISKMDTEQLLTLFFSVKKQYADFVPPVKSE